MAGLVIGITQRQKRKLVSSVSIVKTRTTFIGTRGFHTIIEATVSNNRKFQESCSSLESTHAHNSASMRAQLSQKSQ